MSLLRRGVLTLAALALVAAAAVPAQAADDTPPPSDDGGLASFGIGPAGVERPDGRSFLTYAVSPGTVVNDHVAVINQAAAPVDLTMSSGDVVMSGGSLAVRSDADTDTDVGAWVTLDGLTGPVHVPAQTAAAGLGYVIVPFSLTVPADAEPGDHVGGIVATLASTGKGGKDSPTITLEQRVAARVYIRVAGDLHPGLEITDLHASYRSNGPVSAGSVVVSYTLRNTGNVRMAVEPTVRTAGVFGLLSREAQSKRVDELLPHGSAHRATVITDVWPLVVQHVTVSADAVAGPAGTDPGIGAVEASTWTLAVPWILLAVVLVLVGWWILRRRRRRPTTAGPAPTPELVGTGTR